MGHRPDTMQDVILHTRRCARIRAEMDRGQASGLRYRCCHLNHHHFGQARALQVDVLNSLVALDKDAE